MYLYVHTCITVYQCVEVITSLVGRASLAQAPAYRASSLAAGDIGESPDSDPDNTLPAARHWARKEEKKTEGCMAAGLRCSVWACAQSTTT
jgi:hypothetical protein